MESLPLTWGRFIRIFWAFQWRAWVGIGIVAFPWAIMQYRHPNDPAFFYHWSKVFNGIATPWAVIVHFVALWLVLRKTYAEFQVALVPRSVKL
jgi:hypothetical protein